MSVTKRAKHQSSERRAVICKIANTSRYSPETDLTDLRRQLGFFTASDAIKDVLDRFPPFTEDQERDLIRLLRSSSRVDEVA